jgi:signal transduction histidine kinase
MRAADTGMVKWRREAGLRAGDNLPIATATAVGCAFVLLLLPAHGRNHLETAVAAAVGLALVAFARWLPHNGLRPVAVCVGYLLFAALLRDAAAGSVSGFAALFLLPVIWLAWTAGQKELLVVFGAVLGALAAPLAIAGSSYPANSGRASAILMIATIAVGSTIQVLRRQTSRATASARLLTAQNEGLRELDRMKDEFIAIISHELRTPLSSIAGYLELVLDDAHLLTTDHEEFLGVVSRNVNRLTLLANDLLLLAAAENGTLTFAKTDFELAKLLGEVVDAARPHAVEKSVELRFEVDGGWHVHADRPRLSQLFDNLISNAIKFTPTGGTVALRALPAEDHVLVEVEDSGIGIAADELPRLFDRFYRARSAASRNVDGTGLGLAIAKTIADAHDAQLDVTSKLGHGTSFRLRLATVFVSEPTAGRDGPDRTLARR